MSYPFKSAFRSLYRDKWINLLSIFAVASSCLIITLVFFSIYNIAAITKRLPERFSFVIYLKNNITSEETENIISALKKRDDIASIKYISSDDAIKELQQTLKNASYIFEGLNENPLLPSVEIKLKEAFVAPDALKKISEEIRVLNGVDDIHYGEKVAEAIHLLRKSANNISIILFLTISATVVFITYSTVEILFYRRKEEIEIIKLLGATSGFIRMPFLIEGGIIGLLGGIFGSLSALAFYIALSYRLTLVIPAIQSLVFPFEILLLLPIIGIVLGVLGAVIAVGRLRF